MACDEPSTIASLDVGYLFAHIPVLQTIKVILNNVYYHTSMPLPKISRETLRALLEICTTKTPFRHPNGDLYVQVDGVSMGSCLGPTFADFYMCNLENNTFSDCPELKPKLYARYIDDIFLVVNNLEELNQIKAKFQSDSILNFTHEVEKDNQLSLLSYETK